MQAAESAAAAAANRAAASAMDPANSVAAATAAATFAEPRGGGGSHGVSDSRCASSSIGVAKPNDSWSPSLSSIACPAWRCSLLPCASKTPEVAQRSLLLSSRAVTVASLCCSAPSLSCCFTGTWLQPVAGRAIWPEAIVLAVSAMPRTFVVPEATGLATSARSPTSAVPEPTGLAASAASTALAVLETALISRLPRPAVAASPTQHRPGCCGGGRSRADADERAPFFQPGDAERRRALLMTNTRELLHR